MGRPTRQPLLCENTLDVVDGLLQDFCHEGSDKGMILQRLYGICKFDRSFAIKHQHRLFSVLLQMRLASPQVNFWFVLLLDTLTASCSIEFPAALEMMNILHKVMNVPDPTGAFLESKLVAASCVVNLIQHLGRQIVDAILQDGKIINHLFDLVRMKGVEAQEAGVRALWRIMYHNPSCRKEFTIKLCDASLNKADANMNRLLKLMAPVLFVGCDKVDRLLE